MGYFVIILLIFGFAFFSKSVLGFSLVLAFLLAIAFRFEERDTFIFAFVGGLIVSLVNGTVLGKESLGLLLASGLIYLYGRRFSVKNWLYFSVFVGIGSVVYNLIVGRVFSFWKVILDVVLALVFLRLVSVIQKKYFSKSIVLKVRV